MSNTVTIRKSQSVGKSDGRIVAVSVGAKDLAVVPGAEICSLAEARWFDEVSEVDWSAVDDVSDLLSSKPIPCVTWIGPSTPDPHLDESVEQAEPIDLRKARG